MENFQSVILGLSETFKGFASIIGPYFFKISLAAILVIIGWVAGRMLKRFIRKIIRKVDLDGFLRKVEFDSLVEKMGYKLNSGRFIGDVVR